MILVTGATGYVGSRLAAALRRQGRALRFLARRPEALPVELRGDAVCGDLADPVSLRKALQGVSQAFYLVHSMGQADFRARDRVAAEAFAHAAREAGVRRIIYLGGLGHGDNLSEHLASRHEVGRLLAGSGVPVVEFRASVIIGAGSISFDLAGTLVDKLPVMVTPRWVRTLAQPIAVDDVIAYLLAALDADLPSGGRFEIGGADRVSYADLMREIARQRGLRRLMIPVPALSPRISALWLSLVVPRHAAVGPHLIEGVKNDTTVQEAGALSAFSIRPMGIAEAVRRALAEPAPDRPAEPSALRSTLALGLCFVACFGTAFVGAITTMDGVTGWYRTIRRPAWTPPDWIFGPVWTVLYALMAVAVWRVWRRDGVREARLPLALFSAQLVFNGAWSWIFFGLHRPAAAFAEILGLWLLIAATALFFSARDRLAAALLAPYLAWVTFAAVLNGDIAWRNW